MVPCLPGRHDMISRMDIPWSRINEFLLDCGRIRHPKEFSIHLLEKLNSLIPYDEGMVCFLDTTGALIDEFLLNIEPEIIWEYKEYYSKIEGGRYSVSARAHEKKDLDRIEECVHDWNIEKDDEFVRYYIRPQGIRYTLGLGLYDVNDSLKSTCIIHRTKQIKYSDMEIRILATILPHLRNLYRNFFFDMTGIGANTDDALSCLTVRENEIVALLCKGIAPVCVGQKLFISRPTVYRHIANIYNKLGVSSIQELVVRAYNHPPALPSLQA
jgi:DNA-binding CsgD family transcriptional regulator